MVNQGLEKGERACKKGEDDEECSITVGGYVVKTT
jgi:hypothetical protein